MGLFDSLFGGMEASGKLTPQEAFAGILLGASACDGHIADDEVQGLVTCLLRMKLYQRYTGKQFHQTLNKLLGVLKKRGVDTLIDACCQALPKELIRAAFTNACDIVLADGVVEPDEREFIDKLRAKLGLDGDTARTIAEVMVIKNRG
ncbi:MAG: tellurite resistance TerB family protein [Pirellulaceae bacterium]|nr:tellurite resistance TerB family protein [Pirellulaceae bacterium]